MTAYKDLQHLNARLENSRQHGQYNIAAKHLVSYHSKLLALDRSAIYKLEENISALEVQLKHTVKSMSGVPTRLSQKQRNIILNGYEAQRDYLEEQRSINRAELQKVKRFHVNRTENDKKIEVILNTWQDNTYVMLPIRDDERTQGLAGQLYAYVDDILHPFGIVDEHLFNGDHYITIQTSESDAQKVARQIVDHVPAEFGGHHRNPLLYLATAPGFSFPLNLGKAPQTTQVDVHAPYTDDGKPHTTILKTAHQQSNGTLRSKEEVYAAFPNFHGTPAWNARKLLNQLDIKIDGKTPKIMTVAGWMSTFDKRQ